LKGVYDVRTLSRDDVKNIRRSILIMSQKEFANAVGISQQLISKIEKGQRRITEEVNMKIHETVLTYIDQLTLYKMLDGEIKL
jgi:transcriptional regulator with XRE-family HTH domain